jgi:hypothetical protein
MRITTIGDVDRADSRSLTTWERFERHGKAEFLDRVKAHTA